MEFYPYKTTTIKKKSSPSNLSKFLKVMEINHMNYLFIFCYYIMLW
jgi:hypothetical protein